MCNRAMFSVYFLPYIVSCTIAFLVFNGKVMCCYFCELLLNHDASLFNTILTYFGNTVGYSLVHLNKHSLCPFQLQFY